MVDDMKPRRLFLISLPRSGSTVTQAVLSNHPEIATCPEPWTQLFISAMTPGADLVKAKFNWEWGLGALDALPANDGSSQLRDALVDALSRAESEFNNSLAESDTRWFLDKTPRYYLILPWLFQRYSDARFIILERNLLSVLNSIYRSWCSEGDFIRKVFRYRVDLFDGPVCLKNFLDRSASSKRVYALSYEKLLEDPVKTFSALFEWLGLHYPEGVLDYASNGSYRGAYGDHKRVQEGVLKPKAMKAQLIEQAFSDDKIARSFARGYAKYIIEQGLRNPHPDLWNKGRASLIFDGVLASSRIEDRKVPSMRGMGGLAYIYWQLSRRGFLREHRTDTLKTAL